MAAREYNLIIWGGSGFTGRLAAEYLARKYTPGGQSAGPSNGPGAAAPGATSESVRWAIAGRDRAKLEVVRDGILKKHPHVQGIDILVGSSDDPASLEAVASKANTVLSFAGPFASFGMPLVDACVKCGTDYCDVTGEPTFIRAVVDKHDAAAKKAGACIVNCVGYDSIPWDLGAWAVATYLRKAGDECTLAVGHVGEAKGGISGGTVASAVNLLATTPWATLRAMSSPHFLAASGKPAPSADPEAAARWKTQSSFMYDKDVKRWTMPSIMAGINTKVVGRSASLAPSAPYGPSFAYNESDLCSGVGAAATGTAAIGFFGAMLMFPPTRWLLTSTLLPKPGQGPSENMRETGFAHVYVVGTGKANLPPSSGRSDQSEAGPGTDAADPTNQTPPGSGPGPAKVVAHMEFKNADPGYKGTAALAVEAALCLALPTERAKTPGHGKELGGGCLTPAVALGQVLVDRLNRSDTFAFEVGPLKDTVIRG